MNSFQWGVSRSIGSPAGGADREGSAPSISEIVVGKDLDASSVPLITDTLDGTDTDNVEIDFVNTIKGVAQPYLKLDLTNTLISDYSMSSGGDRPTESLSLNFTKIGFTATLVKGEPQTFTYDLAANQASEDLTLPAITPSSGASKGGDPIYMKYGAITGDVTAKAYAGDIALTSFQWGVSRSIGSPTAGSADRESSAPSVSEIAVGKDLDSSSVPLISDALNGTDTDSVEIDFVSTSKGKAQTYLKLDLTNTLIGNYSTSSGGDRPTESLSLNFTKIAFAYTPVKCTAQTFSYDQTENKADLVLSAAASVTGTSGASGGGGDPIYMKFPGVTGNVTANGYSGYIELDSFQWGVGRSITSSTGSSSDREGSTPSVSEITVGKQSDASSIPLLTDALEGTNASLVEIDFVDIVKGKLQPYLKVDLTNTLISHDVMSSNGDRPTESLSLNYTKISFAYMQEKAQPQTTTYDLLANQAPETLTLPAITPSKGTTGPTSIYMKYGAIAGRRHRQGLQWRHGVDLLLLERGSHRQHWPQPGSGGVGPHDLGDYRGAGFRCQFRAVARRCLWRFSRLRGDRFRQYRGQTNLARLPQARSHQHADQRRFDEQQRGPAHRVAVAELHEDQLLVVRQRGQVADL